LKVSVVGSGGGGGVTTLGDLTDVSLTSPVNGDALVFDGLGVWKNVHLADTYLPLAGGTMDSNSRISWPDWGFSVGTIDPIHSGVWNLYADGTQMSAHADDGFVFDSLNPIIATFQFQNDNIGLLIANDGNGTGNRIIGLVPTPSQDSEATSKKYVDTQAATKLGEAPQNGNVYARKDATWVTTPQALSALNDVTILNPTNTQVLTYNGTKWVNATPSGGGGGIPDAPNDGTQYGRQSLGWTAIAAPAVVDGGTY
jgi:hypothetical protein